MNEEYNDTITKYSCRLVGMVPCSDAFGVDLIIEKFQKKLAENEKLQKDLKEQFLKSDPKTLKNKEKKEKVIREMVQLPKKTHQRFMSTNQVGHDENIYEPD